MTTEVETCKPMRETVGFFLLGLAVFFVLGVMAGKMISEEDHTAQIRKMVREAPMFIGDRTFTLVDERGDSYKVTIGVAP